MLRTCSNVVCGWLLHCKRFLGVCAYFVSTVVCPACLCFGIASTGPDEFRKRGSIRLVADNQAIAEHVRGTFDSSCHVIAYGGDHALHLADDAMPLEGTLMR